MRVGIDGRELCGHPTGVGRYLMGLLTSWSRDSGGHELMLYVPQPVDLPIDGRRIFTRTVSGGSGTWWEQVLLPAAAARDHLDVFFAPAYTTSLFHRIPTVLALHDLSFFAHPEWFTMRQGIRRRWFARESAGRARAIITISQFSKREIVQRLQLPADRVHVVPPGITSPIAGQSGGGRSQASRPNVLYVGSVFNRRHVPDLIRGFAPIARAHSDARLDLVGDNRSHPFEDIAAVIRREGLDGRAAWSAYVSDEELAKRYAAARAFAFLSEYEGLGLTPLEALAAGIPPLLLDTPVARESCDRAALYVSLDNLREMTPALETLLFDETRRGELLAAAPEVLARYNWTTAARDTLRVIEASA